MPIIAINFLRNLLVSILCLFAMTACGVEENAPSSRSSGTGSYAARLIFPADIPRIDAVANALTGIDCKEQGIAVLRFAFFDGADTPLVEDQFPCSAHQAIIKNIGVKIPTLGVYLTCTAMYGSGVPTGMATIPAAALPILSGHLRAVTGYLGAAAGTTLPGAAAHPAARLATSGAYPDFGALASGSDSSLACSADNRARYGRLSKKGSVI